MEEAAELRVAVCDDQRPEGEKLADRIRDVSLDRRAQIDVFVSAEELLASANSYDIIFLDILMDQLDGMEAARQLRLRSIQSLIVFVTSSSDFVFEGYEVNAFRYLMKPVSDLALREVLDKAEERLVRSALIVRAGRDLRRIPFQDIHYLEAHGRRCSVHTRDREVIFPDSLSAVSVLLPARMFFRCQKSFIVNLDWVQLIRRYEAELPGGVRVPIGRAQWPEMRQRVITHLTDLYPV